MAIVVCDVVDVGARVDKANLGGMGERHFPLLAEDMGMAIFILLTRRKKNIFAI